MPTLATLMEARSQLKAEIVRRVLAGEPITQVCAEPRMPRVPTVYQWRHKDASFGAAFDDAMRRGDWRRRFAFDDDRARAFLVRLAAGDTLAALRRDPAMPRPETLRQWRAGQPEFSAEVARLIAVHRDERARRALSHPSRAFDPDIADKVLLHLGRGHRISDVCRVAPGLPGYWIIARWRRENSEFDYEVRVTLRFGRTGRVRQRIARVSLKLGADIAAGGSLRSLAGKKGRPSESTLYRWAARSPDFTREIAIACDARQDLLFDRMLHIIQTAPSTAEARRRVAPISRQATRLQNRPGKRWLG